MFMGKQKKDIENGQIIAESNRGKSAKTPQNLQFTGKSLLTMKQFCNKIRLYGKE